METKKKIAKQKEEYKKVLQTTVILSYGTRKFMVAKLGLKKCLSDAQETQESEGFFQTLSSSFSPLLTLSQDVYVTPY